MIVRKSIDYFKEVLDKYLQDPDKKVNEVISRYYCISNFERFALFRKQSADYTYL